MTFINRPIVHAALAVLLVVGWMATGFVLQLDPNTYLLLGVPLTLVYQAVVRRPVSALWVFQSSSTPFRWRSTALLAVALLVVPVIALWDPAPASERQLPVLLWLICSLLGAPVAAWTISRTSAAGVRAAALNTLSVLLIGGAIFSLAAWQAGRPALPELAALPRLAVGVIAYFTVCFLIEEVFFRGALDPDLSGGALTGSRAWSSAIFVSVLWGLWHLPVISFDAHANLPLLVTQLLALHVGAGVLLSLIARQSGSLALPALVHALLDAWRNSIA